jgi:hypothetical protein
VAELKTKKNDQDVNAFLERVEDEKKRADSKIVMKLMKEATGQEAKMWGDSIVGFGEYHYKYASGHEGDAPLAGFSPRKQALTLYIPAGFEQYGALMAKLGKYKTSKGCLYIKRIEDVDQDTLRELVRQSAEHIARTNA